MSFKRSLHPSEEVQYRELLSLLSNIFLCRNFKDSRIWKSSTSRELLAKAFYLALEETQPSRAAFALVWVGLVPPRVVAFC